MPMRAYRASTAYVGSHVGRNIWLWIAIFAVVAAVIGLVRWSAGGGHHLGDLVALGGMILGILVMVKGQEGYVPPEVADEPDSPAA